ncbi:hypothetical protein H4CHR_01005 [Variovorax sp. PBS-H4]|uniref:hypothetical protein n=1 Tax=Variovorax sp. PBS-H4 TaxID=434008 RepID=UPI0013185565|nr:hypothetical protein [Variovorax sp. PBS-H4]VTU22520.1 hypothetical protein H4CHR_01005 [Variovorax sp. PBS-H4]
MEALTRRFARSKIHKPLKEDDDSSGDEKANKGGGKKVNNLHPPKLKSNWPPHLKNLCTELSERYPVRDFKTPIKTTINLLHALKLDEAACDALRDEGVIVDMVNELQAKTMRFGEKLAGRDAFLVSTFKLLVKLDVKAAQQFHLLCDAKSKDSLARTDEYRLIETPPSAQPAFDRKAAKRELDLFIDKVKSKIKGDPKAYGAQLLLLIQGCPPSARGQILKLLANEKVSKACEKNFELAAAVARLQKMTAEERGQVDTALALLVVDINFALAEAEALVGRQEFDAFKNTKVIDFLQDPKVIELFANVEKSLGEQQFDLETLIATLCRGERTTTSQAKFVAGLMGHLIQSAQERNELFDFCGFLSAMLLSGVPAKFVKWLANSAVGTCRTTGDVERLVEAIEQVGDMTGMEIPQWMALGLLATVVGGDIGNPKYIKPSIKEELETAGLLPQFQQRLQGVYDKSRVSNIRLAASFNMPDQMERDKAEYAKLEAAHTARAQEKKSKEEQQRREDVLMSVSGDVRGALDLMASNPAWDKKLEYAAAMSMQLQKQPFLIQQVVDDLVAVGTEGAAEFLGVLTAMLLADGESELSHEMLIMTLKKSQLSYKVAAGLVGTWYETQFRADQSSLEMITIRLCDALLLLKNEEMNLSQLSSFYTECQIAMKRSAIGFTETYALTPDQRQVLQKIKSLNW